MTTPAAPLPDSPATASARTFPSRPDCQDPPGWRLAFLFIANALEGSWAKFARAIVLMLVLAAAVALLIHLLGPYAVSGLGIGTAGATALARRARIKANAPHRADR